MAGRDDDAWGTEEISLPGVETDGPGEPPAARAAGPRVVRAAEPEVFSTRDEGGATTRRERRQTITFLAFFIAIIVLGLVALAAYFGRLDVGIGTGRSGPLPTCPSVAPSVQAYADTSVNVYNASTRNGLASTVMRELQKRGFRVPTAPANDRKTKVSTMAVIRHGGNGILAAQTVATAVGGPVTYVQDDRPGTDVDLVLGQTFKLAPMAKPSATPSGPAPAATCVAPEE
jgi:hypothetical protein